MSVVHQPVEDAVGQRGIADLLVPAGHRQLRGQAGNGGAKPRLIFDTRVSEKIPHITAYFRFNMCCVAGWC